MLRSLLNSFVVIGMLMAADAANTFTEIVVPPPPFQPMWSPRANAGCLAISQTYMTVSCYNQWTKQTTFMSSASGTWLVVFGGTVTSNGEEFGVNDVWFADQSDASKWCFAAGTTDEGIVSPNFPTTFPSKANMAWAASPSILYVAGGIAQGLDTNDVWYATSNYYFGRWSRATAGAPWTARSEATMVVDSLGYLTIFGGVSQDNPSVNLNDVWTSLQPTSGIWYQLSSTGPGRTSSAMLSYQYYKTMLIIGGMDSQKSQLLNDVWILPEQSKTFKLGTSQAAFPARKNHNVVAASQFAYVLGGSNRTQMFNDVWTTTDQQTWSLCVKSAKWEGRSSFMSAVDPKSSKLWLMGGNGENGLLNDIWVSNFALNTPCKP